MGSVFDQLLKFGPATFVVKAIIAAVAGDVLLIGFILLRRAYRKRYFRRHDGRVLEFRQNWEAILSGKWPSEFWRTNAFDRRIVEEIALNELDSANSRDSARLLQFLRSSGLIDKRILEARKMRGWRRRKALVALGRTRAPEGIHALGEALRDADTDNRHAALRGLGRMASPEAAEEILSWVAESGMRVAALPLQNALINCCRERPQVLVPYLQHANGEVREMLARVMGEVATPSMDVNLLNLAEDDLPELRAAAARAMRNTNAYEALEVLTELAKDPVWYVRLRAVVALGKLNNPEAVPRIIQALTDASRLVRVRAGEALVAQRGELLANFERVIALRDRYGLHAYLAALENAELGPRLEEELRRSTALSDKQKEQLEEVLKSGVLPEMEPAEELAGAFDRK
jgi:HEAT repeat protein